MKYELLALLTDRPDEIAWNVLDLEHPAVQWVKSYYEDFGHLPTLELFAQTCLDEGEKPIATAPWAYYVREAQNLEFVQQATKYLTTFNKTYADDPKQAILSLRDQFAKLSEPNSSIEPADIAKQTKERWERFSRKQGARIKTGLVPFDEASGGLSPDDEFAILSARLGAGKALKYGTKVLSVTGDFLPVETFKEGDFLIGLDGKPTQIVGVRDFDTLNLYRIHFSDGNYIDCCEDHLWTLKKGSSLVTVTTSYLASQPLVKFNKRRKIESPIWFLPALTPVQNIERQLPVPPYIVGSWLASGLASPAVDYSTDKILKEVQEEVLFTSLNRLGLVNSSEHLFIPKIYLMSSPAQRTQLLRGLVDASGALPNKGKIVLYVKSPRLAKDIEYLIESLGGCVIADKDYSRLIVPLLSNKLFKGSKAKPKLQTVARSISSIQPIAPTGGRCFIVDNKDHLFLTEHFIPTHNSFVLHYMALEMAKQGLNVGLYSGEMSEDEVGSRIDTWLTHVSNFDLTRGKLTSSDEQVAAYEEQVPGKILVVTPKHLGHNATPADLRKFCKDNLISVMLIDQLSLMQPDGVLRSESHENFASLSMQLKTLQQELRIPFVAVSQLNRAAQEQEISAANIAGSDRIGQDATLVLSLERKENELSVKVLKARSFKRPERGWTFTWDINSGVLTQQLVATDSIKASIQAAAAQDNHASFTQQPAQEEDEDLG